MGGYPSLGTDMYVGLGLHTVQCSVFAAVSAAAAMDVCSGITTDLGGALLPQHPFEA